MHATFLYVPYLPQNRPPLFCTLVLSQNREGAFFELMCFASIYTPYIFSYKPEPSYALTISLASQHGELPEYVNVGFSAKIAARIPLSQSEPIVAT